VADDGPGIAPERQGELWSIFEHDYRLGCGAFSEQTDPFGHKHLDGGVGVVVGLVELSRDDVSRNHPS
jgi:hypothetical protein